MFKRKRHRNSFTLFGHLRTCKYPKKYNGYILKDTNYPSIHVIFGLPIQSLNIQSNQINATGMYNVGEWVKNNKTNWSLNILKELENKTYGLNLIYFLLDLKCYKSFT